MIFRFKQFEVKHSSSLLKVGTDAVLLGAIIQSKEKINSILDIGTGCGIIALMLAQKFSDARIEAIEIDQPSCEEARQNFINSKFSSQLFAIHSSLQDFRSHKKYDLIVSNPPYFKTPDFGKGNNTQDIKESRKKLATHFNLTFEQLVIAASKLLDRKGLFWVILPHASSEKFVELACQYQLFPSENISIRSKQKGPAIRSILSFGFDEAITIRSRELIIYNDDGTRSAEYSSSTDTYYL